MKLTSSLLILLGAISSHAASIPITQVPYTIVTPGTYVLAADLTLPLIGTAPGITINVNVPGKVLLNLNGHFLAIAPGPKPNLTQDGIDILAGQDIYIENGRLGDSLEFDFLTSISVNPNGNSNITKLEIYNVAFFGAAWNLILNRVNGAVIKSCLFSGTNGVEDIDSKTGNKYLGNTYECFKVGFSVMSSFNSPPFDWKPSAL